MFDPEWVENELQRDHGVEDLQGEGLEETQDAYVSASEAEQD